MVVWAATAVATLLSAGGLAHAQTPVDVTVGSVPRAVAIDPISGLVLVTNSGENSVSVVDPAALKTVGSNIPGFSSPAGVAFNSLGLAVVANQWGNSVSIVDLANRRIRSTITVGASPVGVAVNRNTNTAVVANSQGNSVSIIDLNTLQQVAVLQGIFGAAGIQSVAIEPTLNLAAVASSTTNSLFLVDLAKRQVSAQVTVGGSPSGVAIDPASRTAIVTNQTGSSISLVDLATNKVRQTISGISEPQAVVLSLATRSALVTTGRNATLVIVNLAAGVIDNTIAGLSGAGGLAFDATSGRTMVALADLNSVAVIPSLDLFSVVSSASYSGEAVAPFSIASGFGAGLARSTVAATAVPLSTTLGDVSVRVNNIAAPLYFVSPRQINFQLPALAPGVYPVQVISGGQKAASGTIVVASAAPGVFTQNQQGNGQAAAINEDGRINGVAPPDNVPGATPRSAAARGSIIQMFGTGGGFTQSDPLSGWPPSTAARTTLQPTAQVGGLPAEVVYSGTSPGLVGVWQINVRIPAIVSAGPQIPVVITQGGRMSNLVSIAVQ